MPAASFTAQAIKDHCPVIGFVQRVSCFAEPQKGPVSLAVSETKSPLSDYATVLGHVNDIGIVDSREKVGAGDDGDAEVQSV